MGTWVYVNGVIEVDTCARSSAEALYIAQTVVNNLPLIIGCEHDVEFYLNLVKGENSSSDTDIFGRYSNLAMRNWLKLFEHQTNVLITINGDLRHAKFEETLREVTKMLSRLSSRLFVQKLLVSVISYNKKFVFCDPDFLIGSADKSIEYENMIFGKYGNYGANQKSESESRI